MNRYVISSSGDRTHNQSRLQSHFVVLRHDWPRNIRNGLQLFICAIILLILSVSLLVLPYDQHVSTDTQTVQCGHHQSPRQVHGGHRSGYGEDRQEMYPGAEGEDAGARDVPAVGLYTG